MIYNNDANESPYNFTIIAITGSPEIHVSGKGQSIVDGDITPSTADDTDFGTVLINTWVFHTFTVKNTGSDTLWLGTPSVTGGVFRLAANSLGQSLAPNASGTFVVSFMASVANTYIGQIALYNSDSNESPYNFTVLAKAGVPDIEVSGNGKVIVNPDTAPEVPDDTDFGTMLFNAPGVTHIFTVTNTGTTTLKPSIKAIPPGFKLGANRLAASIEPTKSDTFEITLESSTTLGVKSGTVIIDSNDPDESPFKFDIKGVIKGYEISGTIKYDTNPSQAKPVRGALVTAWNNDGGGDTSLGTAYTDDNGRYTITTTTDADNVYIRVYAQTAPAGNGAGQVKRAIKVEDGISGANFFYDFYPLPDPSLSSSHSQILGADVIIPDTQYSGQAFWAFDAAVTATRFHATLPGVTAGAYEIQFPNPFEFILPGDQTSAAYGGNIYLDPEDWNDWDVVIHEYGHLVAGTAGFFGLTGGPWAWDHRTGENARITNPSADPYDQMQLGFNEGWSNFFSVVCQTIQGVSSPAVLGAGDGLFESHSLEGTTGFGEDEELSVMAILWDLYDSATDGGRDTIAMGMNGLFTLLDTSNPLTLDELWDALMASAPNLATKFQYAEIFELNHVSPLMEGAKPLGSSVPLSKSITVRTVEPSPVFQWTIPVADVPHQSTQLLNDFGIMIFDETDGLVYDSGVLADGSVLIVGNHASFIPGLIDWRANVTSLVGTAPKTFRWIVYGGYYVSETGEPYALLDTGAYWSSHGEIIVTP